MKEANIIYACMAKIVQDSGVVVSVLGRYTILPGSGEAKLFVDLKMMLTTYY